MCGSEMVGNVQKRVGVMVNGRWLSEEQIQSVLAALLESYRPGLIDRFWPLIVIAGAIAMFAQMAHWKAVGI